MNEQTFIKLLEEKGIILNEHQLNQFEQYYELLIEWNEKMNLTSITKKEEVYERHFYDSLTLSFNNKMDSQTFCDVGSGAGFPSIPLKIVFPNLEVTIIDALDKRITFLNHVIETLQLKKIEAKHARAEVFALTQRESFDIVSARAVARLNVLMELCAPLVGIGGYFIAMKGMQGHDEVNEAVVAAQKLGLRKEKEVLMTLPIEKAKRMTIYYYKHAKTPLKYPRIFGKIKKNPL